MKADEAAASIERLRATFQAAQSFGLTDEQVWETVQEVVNSTPADKPAGECLDDLADALAARIRGEK
jgi:hypothetical protein